MSSADTRPILVIVSAGNCGACQNAEKTGIFTKIKTDISTTLVDDNKVSIVRVEHIKKPKIDDPIDQIYPQVLNKWARWFPIFILINGKDWNDKMANIDEKSPNIEVFNGRLVEGMVMQGNPGSMMDYSKVPEWIKNNIDNNTKFKTIIIKSTQRQPLTLPTPVPETETPKYIPTCGAIKLMASSRRNYA